MKTIKLSGWSKRPKNFTGIVEYPSGNKWWYLNDKQHRENGPAIEYSSGTNFWFLNGKYYSENEYKTEMILRSSTLGRLLLSSKTKL